jgi:hypothetical protein
LTLSSSSGDAAAIAAARSLNFAPLFTFLALHFMGAAAAAGVLTVSPAVRPIIAKAADAVNNRRFISIPLPLLAAALPHEP